MSPGLDVREIDMQDDRLVGGEKVTIAPLRLVKNSRIHLQKGLQGLSPSGLQRGDVVVFQESGGTQREIKRLVGLPGESVRISKGDLFIDGVRLTKDFHQALRQAVFIDVWDVADTGKASSWHRNGSAFNGVLSAKKSNEAAGDHSGAATDVVTEAGTDGAAEAEPAADAIKSNLTPYRFSRPRGEYIDNALDGNAHDSHQLIEVSDIGMAMQISAAQSDWGIQFCMNTPQTNTRVLVTCLDGKMAVDGVPIDMGATRPLSDVPVEWIVVMQVDSELVVGDGHQEWYRRPLESKDRVSPSSKSGIMQGEVYPLELVPLQGELSVRSLITFRDIHYRGSRDTEEQTWAASDYVIVLGDNVSASSDARDRWESGLPESAIKGVVLPVGSGLESLLRQRPTSR
jgi:hypothetical protein